MTDFVTACDLFGEPIPRNHGERGRPQHVPTKENANKIMLLLAQGWTDQRIAGALGITRPTLKKHYFSVLKQRDVARDRVEAIGLATLFHLGREGNVAAMKEFFRRHDGAMGMIFEDEVERKKDAVGKKERLRQEADNPPDDWSVVLPGNGMH